MSSWTIALVLLLGILEFFRRNPANLSDMFIPVNKWGSDVARGGGGDAVADGPLRQGVNNAFDNDAFARS